MLTLTGTLKNIYVSRVGQTKDGRDYGGDDRLQIEVKEDAESGTFRYIDYDLKCTDARKFKDLQGTEISVPVTPYSPAKGKVILAVNGAPVSLNP